MNTRDIHIFIREDGGTSADEPEPPVEPARESLKDSDDSILLRGLMGRRLRQVLGDLRLFWRFDLTLVHAYHQSVFVIL